jgi:hypothetical protein
LGRTSVSTVSVLSVASEALTPDCWNVCSPWRSAPIRMQAPTSPLRMIITAANTVSLASVAELGPPCSMSVTISPTSITVTASASINEPYGSPTRWAISSA